MESGYKILWTNHALNELANTYEYLEIHFAYIELQRLSVEISSFFSNRQHPDKTNL